VARIAANTWEPVGPRQNMIPIMRSQRCLDGGFYVSIDVIIDPDIPFGETLTAALGERAVWREAPFRVKDLDELPRALTAHWMALFVWTVEHLAGAAPPWSQPWSP
jgi:hypothetical protein